MKSLYSDSLRNTNITKNSRLERKQKDEQGEQFIKKIFWTDCMYIQAPTSESAFQIIK